MKSTLRLIIIIGLCVLLITTCIEWFRGNTEFWEVAIIMILGNSITDGWLLNDNFSRKVY